MTAKTYAQVIAVAGSWLHAEVPVLSMAEATRLMLYTKQRRDIGRELSPTETTWLQAWDRIYAEMAAQEGA